MNTQMLEEMLGHLAAAREDDAVRVLVISSNDHLGLSAGADVREELADDEARVQRMQLFADSTTRSSPSRSRRSPPATARSSAAAPRSRWPATCASRAATCG